MAALKHSIEKPGAKDRRARRREEGAGKEGAAKKPGQKREGPPGAQARLGPWPASDPLATYNAKRDFTKTAEPAGKAREAPRGDGNASSSRSTTRRGSTGISGSSWTAC